MCRSCEGKIRGTCDGCIQREDRCMKCRRVTRGMCCDAVMDGMCTHCVESRWKGRVKRREEETRDQDGCRATVEELREKQRWKVSEEGNVKYVMYYHGEGWEKRVAVGDGGVTTAKWYGCGEKVMAMYGRVVGDNRDRQGDASVEYREMVERGQAKGTIAIGNEIVDITGMEGGMGEIRGGGGANVRIDADTGAVYVIKKGGLEPGEEIVAEASGMQKEKTDWEKGHLEQARARWCGGMVAYNMREHKYKEGRSDGSGTVEERIVKATMIWEMCTTKDVRGLGLKIGSRMIREIDRRTKGATQEYHLVVRGGRQQAHAMVLYRRLGFRKIGELNNNARKMREVRLRAGQHYMIARAEDVRNELEMMGIEEEMGWTWEEGNEAELTAMERVWIRDLYEETHGSGGTGRGDGKEWSERTKGAKYITGKWGGVRSCDAREEREMRRVEKRRLDEYTREEGQRQADEGRRKKRDNHEKETREEEERDREELDYIHHGPHMDLHEPMDQEEEEGDTRHGTGSPELEERVERREEEDEQEAMRTMRTVTRGKRSREQPQAEEEDGRRKGRRTRLMDRLGEMDASE